MNIHTNPVVFLKALLLTNCRNGITVEKKLFSYPITPN